MTLTHIILFFNNKCIILNKHHPFICNSLLFNNSTKHIHIPYKYYDYLLYNEKEIYKLTPEQFIYWFKILDFICYDEYKLSSIYIFDYIKYYNISTKVLEKYLLYDLLLNLHNK